MGIPKRHLYRLALAIAMAGGWCVAALPAAAQEQPQPDPWPVLATQIFGDRPLLDGGRVVAIDAPYRAADAAIVPITIRTTLAPGDQRTVRKLTLVIDDNPSPLAAQITLGSADSPDRLSTNVRVDSYTFMHVVAELSDGKLYVVKRFVKAAGGCSAPALKGDAGGVPLGTMRFRRFAAPAGAPGMAEAQLMIRHPNFSGMQMDQLTHLYIPAHFVQTVRLYQGKTLLAAIDGGISISENPQFRFDYRPQSNQPMRAKMTDSTGKTFDGSWPASGS